MTRFILITILVLLSLAPARADAPVLNIVAPPQFTPLSVGDTARFAIEIYSTESTPTPGRVVITPGGTGYVLGIAATQGGDTPIDCTWNGFGVACAYTAEIWRPLVLDVTIDPGARIQCATAFTTTITATVGPRTAVRETFARLNTLPCLYLPTIGGQP